jgi:hypothetical protein
LSERLVLDPKKLAQGFDRGFDIYDADFIGDAQAKIITTA